jgi:hypothetical protein
LTRTRTLLAILALAIPTLAISACGGDDDESPDDVVQATLSNDEGVSSGVLSMSLNASAGGAGSFEASLEGPFQSDPDAPTALPQLDWDASLSGEGLGQSQSFDGGLVVTEDNAFVEYQGETYEVGTKTFGSFKESFEETAAQSDADDESAGASFSEACVQALESQGGDASVCDEIDVNSWFTNLSNEGTEDIEGTESVHISGDLDLARMLEDFVKIGAAGPENAGVDPSQIEAGLDQINDAIDDASFDLYSSEDANQLTGLDFDLSIDASSLGATPIPIETVDVGFNLRIGDLNAEQTIEAPTDAKPLEDLLSQLGVGGLGPLGGEFDITPGGGAGGGDAPDPGDDAGGDAASEQLDCIAEAGNDPEALQDCLE